VASQRMQILLEVQDKATRALRKTSKGFKKLGRIAAKAGKTIGRAMGRIVKSILSLKTALVAVAGAAGFGLLIKSAMSSIDALGKVSKKLGIASDDLQRFRLAAELSGVASTTLDMGLQRFTRRAAEAAMGTGEAKDALLQLGVALKNKDLKGYKRFTWERDSRTKSRRFVMKDKGKGDGDKIRKTRDMIRDVAEGLLKIKDPADQLRIAFKLFDSEGVAFVNMLNKGGKGFDELMSKADSLGSILTQKTVKDVQRANDAFSLLGMAMLGVRDNMAGALAPSLERFATWWTEFMSSFNSAIKPLWEWMILKLGELGGGFDSAKDSGDKWGKLVGWHIQELVKSFVGFFKVQADGTSKWTKYKDAAIKSFNAVKEKVMKVFNSIAGWLDENGADMWKTMIAGASAVLSIVRGIVAAYNSLRSLGAKLAGSGAGSAGTAAPSIMKAIRESRDAKTLEMFRGKRASGGGVSAGGSYMVGERGAELFTPTTAGTVSASGGGTTTITNIYTSATAHGIDNALASRGDNITRGGRVGLKVGAISAGGYISLSTARAR